MSPGARNGLSWSAGALIASIVGHLASLLIIPLGSASYRPRPEVPPAEIEFFVEPLPPEPVVAPPEPAAAIPERAEVPDRVQEPVAPETTPEIVPETTAEADPREQHPETTQTNDAPRILDTRAVARTVLATEGPRMPRAAETSTFDVETPAQRDRRLAGALDTTLRSAATARPEGFGRRVLPEPVRRADGSLAYPLGQVTAIVNRDGTFTFDDTTGVDFEGMGGAQREGATARWGLEEWMMRRHGADPHAATRRWFAEQTEEMRDEMMQNHIAGQARSAARGIRGRLTRLLADEARPIADRRRAIFDQWDDCSEGELVGDAVRAAIIELVRERLPESSPDAYQDTELDELNRHRESTAEFRPYAH